MKLLVVSHTCATPINQQLYAEVSKIDGWEIDLVVPANWKNEYGNVLGAQRWPEFKGRVLPVPVRWSGNIILHSYKTSFARLIRNSNPDFIYMNHEPYAVATAQVYWANLRTKRCPIGFYSCQNILKKYPPPFRWTEAAVLKQSQFAFPISTDVDQVFRSKGYTGASTVLPLGIDTQTYSRKANHMQLRSDLRGTAEVVLGFVGRLVPEKGLKTLLAALVQITDLSWKLVLVGSGPAEAELRSLAQSSGIIDRIDFRGYVDHVETPKYLSAFDLLILPSETQANWREQFGRVILEAMACGTPVLGSDSGEIPNLIRKSGGGLVFRERDPGDLAQKLRMLLVDPKMRMKLADNGSTSVHKSFSLSVLARQFVQTISAVADSDRFALLGSSSC